MKNGKELTSEASKKSLEQAKKNLQSILTKIDDLDRLTRAFKLFHARFRLKPFGIRLGGKHLWLIFGAAWILMHVLQNYVEKHRNGKCLLELPSFTQTIFRPAEDCSICRGVQEVDKIDNVDPAVFEERYAYSGRPVVVTDAMLNWTAPEIFSFNFFKSLYTEEDGNCQFFPYKTEFRSLREVFKMGDNRALMEEGTAPWYVGWSNCDNKIGAVLRKHYQRPYFLPVTAESEKTDWIFMGSHGYGAPMHVDNVEHPSWQAQIKGEKLWILEPPRECYYTCKRLRVIVHPGEIIVLDTNRWYHQTVIASKEMSITIGAEYD
ncbi:uncharacterized protein [Prorops nasuta]|uniref:uncharacterized protein n=1 Tax=Prorops nasuta TaxID=863751 RepID=UPI0034CFA90A